MIPSNETIFHQQFMEVFMDKQKFSKLQAAVPGLAAFVLLLAILLYPKDAYQAALSGLNIFLRSVFPALLPFFIASEIMTGLGVVDFLSVLLNPVMGPLFRCPGSSSFIWVMSITSGYPTGARLTALFRKQKRITAEEAQRVLSFCSTSGPLFMMGAVAIGMMGSPEGGTIILASHYIAAILIGLAFRFYHSRDAKREKSRVSLQKALTALNDARKQDGRPIGELMGDSVRNSVNVLLVVGGFIMLFSVVIDLLMRLQVIDSIAAVVSVLLQPFHIEYSLVKALIGSLFEVTTGAKLVSETAVSMQHKIAAVSFVIGWSGFSIHAQAASLLAGSGVKFRLYLLNKFLHGVIAALISLPLTMILYPEASEVYNPIPGTFFPGWKESFLSSLHFLSYGLIFVAGLSLVSYMISRYIFSRKILSRNIVPPKRKRAVKI
jgi:sporulation integral membrane protein YlbJ